MIIAAGARYAFGRSLAGTAAFPYVLSVGWHGGVLQGIAGYMDW